jgi:hypothetical protein
MSEPGPVAARTRPRKRLASGAMRRTTFITALLALSLVAAACTGGKDGPSPTTPTAPVSRPSSTAKLRILSPTEGQTITGKTVTVVVSLTGAKIVKPVSTVLKPNEGHIHVSLDNALVTMTASLKTVLPVTPGHHVIEVDFVANDHGPFDPPVVAVVTIDVRG